jgi:hypothetical protein
MRRSSLALLVCVLAALSAQAQVVTVFDIKDPAARRLQQKYISQLRAIGGAIEAHKFPYTFYLSRVLDIDEKQQLRLPQDSIRFAKYNSQMVLEITGNYYASYADDLMDRNKRAKQTFLDVVLPILQAAVAQFPADDSFGAFAIEISHHVRRKVVGVSTEDAENLVVILPRAAAHHLIKATMPDEQQAAVLEGEVYVNTEPIALWISGKEPPQLAEEKKFRPKSKARKSGAGANEDESASLDLPSAPEPSVSPNLVKGNEFPVRLITPETLNKLRSTQQETIGRMVRTLDAQAHFVPYAPPDFIAFHQGAYLQLSLTTPLQATSGSRYYLAALAFDEHISHLIRPVLAFFPQDSDFDGISFSTTLKMANGNSSQAVEFFFPFKILRCFANYDCTGQQLIDSAFVLINGERATLNLQVAEASR